MLIAGPPTAQCLNIHTPIGERKRKRGRRRDGLSPLPLSPRVEAGLPEFHLNCKFTLSLSQARYGPSIGCCSSVDAHAHVKLRQKFATAQTQMYSLVFFYKRGKEKTTKTTTVDSSKKTSTLQYIYIQCTQRNNFKNQFDVTKANRREEKENNRKKEKRTEKDKKITRIIESNGKKERIQK